MFAKIVGIFTMCCSLLAISSVWFNDYQPSKVVVTLLFICLFFGSLNNIIDKTEQKE